MKIVIFFICYTPFLLFSQSAFDKKYDNLGLIDWGMSLSYNFENGIIISGNTYNNLTGDDSTFIVNTDCNGNIIWHNTINISQGSEFLWAVNKTIGGYIYSGHAYNDTFAILNYFLFKTDYLGNLLWLKYYGDTLNSQCWDMIATRDSGFLMIGNTFLGNDTINGYIQAWLIKTDSIGNVEWERKFGGINADYVYNVKQTPDSGYIVAGQTASMGAGSTDLWLFKTDSEGNLQWQQAYGTIGADWGGGVDIALDKGYILTGSLNVNVATIACIIKTDSLGNEQWRKTYGFEYGEALTKVKSLPDSGYIASGSTNFNPQVGFQGWIARFNSDGDTLWTKMFGGPYDEYFYDLILTDDGGFAMAGVYTQAIQPNDYDMWLVKTDSNGCALPECDYGCEPCTYIEAAFLVSSDTIDLQYTDTIHFYDQSTFAQHWFWDFGDETTDTLQNPLHVYDSSGTYQIMMVAYYSACSDTAWQTIVVLPAFHCDSLQSYFTVSDDTIDLQYTDTIHFYDQSTFAQHWYWNFGDNTTDTVQNPLHVFDTTGVFIIMLVTYYMNCADTVYDTVVVVNSVGVNSNNSQTKEVRIVPNPAQERVRIITYEPEAELTIYNIHGIIIREKHFFNETEFDVSDWQRGVYLIKLTMEKDVIITKFVKK